MIMLIPNTSGFSTIARVINVPTPVPTTPPMIAPGGPPMASPMALTYHPDSIYTFFPQDRCSPSVVLGAVHALNQDGVTPCLRIIPTALRRSRFSPSFPYPPWSRWILRFLVTEPSHGSCRRNLPTAGSYQRMPTFTKPPVSTSSFRYSHAPFQSYTCRIPATKSPKASVIGTFADEAPIPAKSHNRI